MVLLREIDERRVIVIRWSIIGGGVYVGLVNLVLGSMVGGEEILDEFVCFVMLVLIFDVVGILLSLWRRVSDVWRCVGDESKGV